MKQKGKPTKGESRPRKKKVKQIAKKQPKKVYRTGEGISNEFANVGILFILILVVGCPLLIIALGRILGPG